MKLPATGSCQCGQVQLQLESAPLFSYACHCHDCQKRTGSAFSMGLVCLADGIKISGQLSDWTRTSEDSHTNTRYSCADCGNIIYGASTASEGLWKLQTGLLEDTAELRPEVHIWICRKQQWISLPADVPVYERQPGDLTDLLTAAVDYRGRLGS
jgi:hypothetical protein